MNDQTADCDAPCCQACGGKGADLSGPCSDCYGTGHTHPTADNDAANLPSDAELDALVILVENAKRGGCFRHDGCIALVEKKQRDAARRWFLSRVTPPERPAQ